MVKVATGFVYDIFDGDGVKVDRVTISELAEATSKYEMWTLVGRGRSSHNVAHFVGAGHWKLYSQNPLNGGS